MTEQCETADLIVIGGGAAGLMTAIAAGRARRSTRIVLLDGAARLGAKILVSGGARCNVTNRRVGEHDFWGGSPRAVRHVLRAFSAERAAAFFGELGVALHEEEDGKLFPDTNRARTILDALLAECQRLGVAVYPGRRVVRLTRDADGFLVLTGDGVTYRGKVAALATGGRSLPKSGSDGGGYELASTLGHGHVATTPALAPLIFDGDRHAVLSGVTHPAEIAVRVDGRITARLAGSFLWTHFGASGPVVLNASRHWHRHRLEGRDVSLLLNICPGETFESVEAWVVAQQAGRPRATIGSLLGRRLPAALAESTCLVAGVPAERSLSHLGRDERRAIVHAMVGRVLEVRDSRGYNYAEVTAGGVPLDEIDPATMESRCCRGLYLVGEVLDVDGRLGGFNFQWAWSSGFVAGTAAAGATRDVT